MGGVERGDEWEGRGISGVSCEVEAVEKERGLGLFYSPVGCVLHKRFNRVCSEIRFVVL